MEPEQHAPNASPRTGRSRREWARDLIDWWMAAFYLVLAFTGARGSGARLVPVLRPVPGLPNDAPVFEPVPGLGSVVEYGSGWSRVLPGIAAVLLVGVFRRKPHLGAACLALVMVETGLSYDSWDTRYFVFLVAVVAMGYVAAANPRAVSVPCTLIMAVPWMGSVIARSSGDTHLIYTAHLPVALLLTALSWLVGDSMRERRAHRDRLRAEHTAQAVTTERLRIARELHDMIAHSIGIIAIQAGVGSRVIATQPDEARKALQAIEETSRDTLAGLRRTLTALRQTDTGAVPTDPAPGLADLPKLVASTRHAGVRVELVRRGLPRPMPTDIDLAAYRIVQESVTNVVRHAGTHQCRVIVEYGDQELAITVIDDGHGSFGDPGSGFGLVGMRERVHLLHGEFNAGPRPTGGFVVMARLPVPGFGTTFATAGRGGDKVGAKSGDASVPKPDKGEAADGGNVGSSNPAPADGPAAAPAADFGPRAAAIVPEAS